MRLKVKKIMIKRRSLYVTFGSLTAIASSVYISDKWLKNNMVRSRSHIFDDYIKVADYRFEDFFSEEFANNSDFAKHKQLLRLAQHSKDANIKQSAMTALATNTFHDFQMQEIAQSCDHKTGLILARMPNVNSKLFLPPIKSNLLNVNIDKLGNPSNLNLNTLLDFILKEASLSNSECSECHKYFTELAIRTLEREHQNHHDLDYDTIHSYRRKRAEINWICLQAISGLTLCGESQCQKLVNNGLFVLLNNIRERFSDLKVQSWIAQTLANLSVFKQFHSHFWYTRWIAVIVDWLQSNSIELSLPAAKILYNLSAESNTYLPNSLYILHPIYYELSNKDFDVVLVHGLLGGALRTWRQCDSQKSDQFYTRCWPQTWLSNDINNIRILAVDYQTYLSNWNLECPSEKFTLKDRSCQLLTNLLSCKVGDKPIIWITHSMGGLLVKQMLTDINDSVDPELKKILKQTKGIIFYSVPHKGSNMAVWSPRIQRIISPSSEVLELRKDSQTLLLLHEKFVKLADVNQIKCLSFGETLKSTIGLRPVRWKALLVPEESSNPGIGSFHSLPSDHYNTCKPIHKSSLSYSLALNFIKEIIDENKIYKNESKAKDENKLPNILLRNLFNLFKH